jgi:hypothetical protein
MLSQLADAIVGLLREDDARLCPLERCLARRNYLCARARIDVRELRFGNAFGC